MRPIALLAALLALTLGPAAAARAADPPTATTGTATAVAQTTATLVAVVDPQGASTSVRFDLGTGTAYGLQSAARDVGNGTEPVSVEIPVAGLTADTTYHVRVVATSEGGTTLGGDVTLRTTAVPVRPTVSTAAAREITPTTALLAGSVTPHGQATTYRFQWGTSTRYGSETPVTAVGSGTAAVAVSAPLTGLRAGQRYSYRLVATNASGTTNGAARTFTATGTPTAATLVAASTSVTYGRPAILSGRLTGSRTSGVAVRLQLTPFPFAQPFADVGAALRTTSSGTYRFTIQSLTVTTRALVVAEGAPSIASKIVVVRSAARVGVLSVRRTAVRATVAGRILPVTAGGVAALQRRTLSGRWVPLRRARIGADGRYAVTVNRRAAPLTVRVVGLPRDGGAHAPGFSRTVSLPGRR